MPHYRCADCKVRVDQADAGAQLVDDGCPICLGPLTVVTHLSELVGLRKVGPDDDLMAAPIYSASTGAPAELRKVRLARAIVDEMQRVD
ncbi:MAG: hypothetical protein QOK04_2414 [Solirubrobacteraceae bacterium]|nr:hypothetical protein [Solirubrobacteraceae bacterium]